MKPDKKRFIIAGFAGTVTVLAVTIAIYATFFHELLGQFTELSDETITLISRDPVNVPLMVLANLAHGFLIAVVIQWGKFFTTIQGAKAAAVVAFLTEVYFCFSQYAILKTMSLVSAVADTCMWTFINLFVGAVVALILRNPSEAREQKTSDT
ncbi:MAG: hypothetical protein IJV40_06025 [Oscillospiraceae bacterium]|nr:hypothetical protein [Oscillospiraceae bacterium]